MSLTFPGEIWGEAPETDIFFGEETGSRHKAIKAVDSFESVLVEDNFFLPKGEDAMDLFHHSAFGSPRHVLRL